MQNRDGGWAAFDLDNDKEFLNEIPFSDMDSLCDPSSPDVAGRVLEAFGILGRPAVPRRVPPRRRVPAPLAGAGGQWFGRWGVNYVYGTSNVLNGLARQASPASDPMVARALRWLRGGAERATAAGARGSSRTRIAARWGGGRRPRRRRRGA